MNIYNICIIVSSLSFFAYVSSYFLSPHMKDEFVRFKLEKFGLLTIAFQFLGALGLLVGLLYRPALLLSSCGLTILMFLGVIVRIKLKDSIIASSPALFYMFLNFYILIETLKL